jgi:diguanylate cyclase (GGDEF)-like protein
MIAENQNEAFSLSARKASVTPDEKLHAQVEDLRRALAASQKELAAALAEKNAVEAHLRAREDLFRTRADDLSRYQAELEAANDRLRNLAVTDDLTGLRNRRAFEERLTFEFSMARRKKRDLSVVLLDADDFKGVNDRLGHPAGDAVLQHLARVLQNTVRLTDLAVRFGGEEFAVILPENDEHSALLWCRRVQRALAATEWEHQPVTVSMGAAGMTPACVDGSHLVAMADQALYRAKHRGKNCFVGASDVEIETPHPQPAISPD